MNKNCKITVAINFKSFDKLYIVDNFNEGSSVYLSLNVTKNGKVNVSLDSANSGVELHSENNDYPLLPGDPIPHCP